MVPTGHPAAVMENNRERSVGGAHCPQMAWLLGNKTPCVDKYKWKEMCYIKIETKIRD